MQRYTKQGLLQEQKLDVPPVLYHGNVNRIEVIQPGSFNVIDGDKAVFATPLRWLALAFIPSWNDSDIELGFSNEEGFLLEKKKNAFSVFETAGYLHQVSGRDFHSDPRLGLQGMEFISDQSVTVDEIEEIENVRVALHREQVTMIPYDIAIAVHENPDLLSEWFPNKKPR
jgi:hypothetical protein